MRKGEQNQRDEGRTDVWKFDETGDESRLCRREPQASGERKVKEEEEDA
jgi:hypothetical protein